MNCKLIFGLSLFGLGMAIATVFVIPSTIEPIFWLVIFLVCAYIIAKRAPGKYFLHGFMVSVINSLWITALHVLLYSQYAATHAREVAMMESLPLSPRIAMAVTGPIIGMISGVVLGLFAFVASKLVRRGTPTVQAPSH